MALILDGTDGITSSGGTNVLQDDAVITANITDGAVTMPKIGAAGNPGAGNFLRGDGAWETAGSPPGTLELLQEDTFTTSGTFTKAAGFDDDDTVMLFLIGGGGSGGAVRLSNSLTDGIGLGGTGGCCLILYGKYSDITGTVFTLTVGAGGSAVSSATDGNPQTGNLGNGTTLVNSVLGFRASSGGGTAGSGFAHSDRIFSILYGQEFGVFFNPARCAPARVANRFSSGEINLTEGTPIGIINNSAHLAAAFSVIIGANGIGRSDTRNELTTEIRVPAIQIVGSGGNAARQGATNRATWNPKVPALFNTGGNGSGTANGQNATALGGGGGGCVRPAGTTATSGAGGVGGMVVQYYRGRVSPFQVISAGA